MNKRGEEICEICRLGRLFVGLLLVVVVVVVVVSKSVKTNKI